MILKALGTLVYASMAAVGYVILAPFALAAKVQGLVTGKRVGPDG